MHLGLLVLGLYLFVLFFELLISGSPPMTLSDRCMGHQTLTLILNAQFKRLAAET